jgi:hypothetical protein
MAHPRRKFLESLLAIGAAQGLTSSPAAAATLCELLDQNLSQNPDPDFDPESHKFWSGFTKNIGTPVIFPKQRGRQTGSPFASDDHRPVFLHFGEEGFRNAVELGKDGLVPEGDVRVSLNTSVLKIAEQDQETFDHVQNAQVRVDVHQATPILPVLEAMGWTMVSGMLSVRSGSASRQKSASGQGSGAKASGSKPARSRAGSGSIQNVTVESGSDWQKMQNIILPGGSGRWTVNIVAQRKDSFLHNFLKRVIEETGQLATMISLPGVAMSALHSFDLFYSWFHEKPVHVMKGAPLQVFATQDAILKTGVPGAAEGIMLQRGTYVLAPANQVSNPDIFKGLIINQGRIVPPKTNPNQIDEAALDTLKGVTYMTFNVTVSPVRIIGDAPRKQA